MAKQAARAPRAARQQKRQASVPQGSSLHIAEGSLAWAPFVRRCTHSARSMTPQTVSPTFNRLTRWARPLVKSRLVWVEIDATSGPYRAARSEWLAAYRAGVYRMYRRATAYDAVLASWFPEGLQK